MCYNDMYNKDLRSDPRKSLKHVLVQIFFETQEYEVGIPSNRKSSRSVNTVTSLVHTARQAKKLGVAEDFVQAVHYFFPFKFLSCFLAFLTPYLMTIVKS